MDIKAYWDICKHYWGVWRHNEKYSERCVILAYATEPYSEIWLIYNPRTRSIFKSVSNMWDDHAYLEPCHSQNSLFKHFQGYLGIFKDIDAYSGTLTGAQLGGRGETSPALFENRKKCPDFGKKGPDCVHL